MGTVKGQKRKGRGTTRKGEGDNQKYVTVWGGGHHS